MNVEKILCNIYVCFLFTPHAYHGKDSLNFKYTQNLLHTEGGGF